MSSTNMLKKFARRIWRAKSGSDTVEMIGVVFMLCAFILIGLMLLSYVMEVNIVNMAARQGARNIETSGIADVGRANSEFRTFLGGNPHLSNFNVTLNTSGQIQLTNTFTLVAECSYDIPLVNPGNFSGYTLHLPIKIRSSGMSEVYWSGLGH